MDRQYVIGADRRHVSFQEMVDAVRTDDKVKVFQYQDDGSLVPVNINFVPELSFGDHVANGVISFPGGETYTLKSGHIVKRYTSNWSAPAIMASIISRIPGFAPVIVENNTLTYEPLNRKFDPKSHRKYIYQLFKNVYELHRRGVCHLNLTPSSIGLIDDNLVISEYENARLCYSALDQDNQPIYYRDIQACGNLISYIAGGNQEYAELISNCLTNQIVRITRVLQHKLFADLLDIELVSVRPCHIYSTLPPIQPSRQSLVTLSGLLQTKLEPSVSQSLAIEILLATDIYDYNLAHQLVTGVSSTTDEIEIQRFIDLFVGDEVGTLGSTGHLVEAYGGSSFSHRAVLSLYSLAATDLDQAYFAGLACIWDAQKSGTEVNPEIENIAPGDTDIYVRKLRISQPVASGLTIDELTSL